MNDKGTGRIVSIQQRLHEDDLAGHLLNLGTFTVLELKAIAEEDERYELYRGRIATRRKGEALFSAREPLETLMKIREELGSFPFSAQYQQNPIAIDGNILRWDWFHTYEEDYTREDFLVVVQSWDTAITAEPQSDFSVCTTWGYRDRIWYLLEVFRKRLEFPDLKDEIRAHARLWQAGQVIVEKDGAGQSVVQALRKEGMLKVHYFSPNISKERRAKGQTDKIAEGRIKIPTDASWLEAFRREVSAFPNGRYDDQVDSMVQFLAWLDTPAGCALLNRDPRTGRPRSNRKPRRHWQRTI